MLGKPSGQMGFGDLEATGRVPESHFLKRSTVRLIGGPSRRSWNLCIIPSKGDPAIRP